MTRIQQILDKADREGAAVRRVHTESVLGAPVAPPAVAPPTAAPHPPSPTPAVTHANGARPLSASAAAPVASPPPAATIRIVSGTRLDARLITAASTDGAIAEQYRALRTRILHADPQSPVSMVMLTSPGRGEGRTLTTGNLGLAMAQEWQRRICIVDTDLRRPCMHRLFGLPDGPGLCDVVTGRATLEEALVTLEEHQVTILPAGNVPAHPAELLGTTAMRRLLDSLRQQFDRVLLDAPPATPLADVSILAPMVDRVLIVVRSGHTTRPAIQETVSSIEPAKLLGFVLNEAN